MDLSTLKTHKIEVISDRGLDMVANAHYLLQVRYIWTGMHYLQLVAISYQKIVAANTFVGGIAARVFSVQISMKFFHPLLVYLFPHKAGGLC